VESDERTLLYASRQSANFALDRLSRYEAILWRQVRQILSALDALDRRKPQERRRRSRVDDRAELPISDDYG
jgi:hypothetical protein